MTALRHPSLHRRDPGRRLRPVLAGLALMAAAWQVPAETLLDDSEAAADARAPLSPAALVVGILRYTSWPGDPQRLLLCVSEGGDTAAQLRSALERGATGSVKAQVREIQPDGPVADDCAMVLFEGWREEPMRRALRSLAGRPVLTIGWGHGFCSDGGMFCLDAVDRRHRFEVNLDAVARSRLRVHPQVLWLARPRSRRA